MYFARSSPVRVLVLYCSCDARARSENQWAKSAIFMVAVKLDKTFEIRMLNRASGHPHNISIYKDGSISLQGPFRLGARLQSRPEVFVQILYVECQKDHTTQKFIRACCSGRAGVRQWLLCVPATRKVDQGNGSAQTVVRATTLRQELQIKLARIDQQEYRQITLLACVQRLASGQNATSGLQLGHRQANQGPVSWRPTSVK